MSPSFESWFAALEQRYTRTLTFPEIRRAVQAVSSIYVERRNRIGSGSVFNGAGKRAAFGLFFAPLHFLLVREILSALNAVQTPPAHIVDLGCGTGSAGAAWTTLCSPAPALTAIDRNAWALEEAKWTYRFFGISGSVRNNDAVQATFPAGSGILAAFLMNELEKEARERLLRKILAAVERNSSVLVVEPIARSTGSWWKEWVRELENAGGTENEWRFRVSLPERLALLDRASGLDHRELTARSLWIGKNQPSCRNTDT